MNPEKESKLSLTAALLIIGVSSLMFNMMMKLLDETISPLFFRAGIITVVAGILLETLRFIARFLYRRKKMSR